MTKQTSIAIYLTKEEARLIENACQKVSLNKSSFLRSLAILEARKIIGGKK